MKEENIKDQAECFENTRLSQSSSLILYIQRKPDFCYFRYFHGICNAQRGDEN
jgi:hypothetical protein